jgi:hypothetical protein
MDWKMGMGCSTLWHQQCELSPFLLNLTRKDNWTFRLEIHITQELNYLKQEYILKVKKTKWLWWVSVNCIHTTRDTACPPNSSRVQRCKMDKWWLMIYFYFRINVFKIWKYPIPTLFLMLFWIFCFKFI